MPYNSFINTWDMYRGIGNSQGQNSYAQFSQAWRQGLSTQGNSVWLQDNAPAIQAVETQVIEEEVDSIDSKEGNMINNFLIGCDPEFVVLGAEGHAINIEAIIHEDDGGQGEGFGSDHDGRVAELRPEPTKGTYALVKSLQRLIQSPRARKLIEKGARKFRAGARAGRESLGGHVHFGLKFSDVGDRYERDAAGHIRITPEGDLVSKQSPSLVVPALDITTKLLEHLDILPKLESQHRRTGHYGKFGDIRNSNGHLEYRTMASWLYDPKVAYVCLTAAKLAGSDAAGTIEALKGVSSFEGLVHWFERYQHKDGNARRAVENVFNRGLKGIQIDPDVDFKERWGRIGI